VDDGARRTNSWTVPCNVQGISTKPGIGFAERDTIPGSHPVRGCGRRQITPEVIPKPKMQSRSLSPLPQKSQDRFLVIWQFLAADVTDRLVGDGPRGSRANANVVTLRIQIPRASMSCRTRAAAGHKGAGGRSNPCRELFVPSWPHVPSARWGRTRHPLGNC
jgi:hypothetical protein